MPSREPDSIDVTARKAVEILGIDRRFEPRTRGDGIFERFAECETLAEKEPAAHADAAFISTALPVASALIHYATTLDRLEEASRWVTANWHRRDAEPATVLAILTLQFVVDQGVKRHRRTPQEKLWLRMKDRLDRLQQEQVAA